MQKEVRVILDDDEFKFLGILKTRLGVRQNSEVVRYAIKHCHDHINGGEVE